MKRTKIFVIFLIFIFFFGALAYGSEEGKAIKEIKFLMKKGLYENALVRADFYLDKDPKSLRVRRLKIDLLIKVLQFDDALKDYEVFIRYSRAKKENIGILSDIVVSYLRDLRKKGLKGEQRKRVFSILCEIKDKDTIGELKEIYVFPKNRSEKIWAASLLAQVGKKGYITYLRKSAKLEGLTKEEKLYIIFAFASRENAILKNTLLSMLKKEKNKEIIAYIYWALTRLGESHRKELRTMLNRVDDRTKGVILFLLGDLKDSKFTLLKPLRDEDLLPHMYWAMFRKGEKTALDNLRKLVSSPSKKASIASIFYIGLIGDGISIPLLRHKIVTTSDMDIKISALSSIVRIIRKDRIKTDIKIKIGFSIIL